MVDVSRLRICERVCTAGIYIYIYVKECEIHHCCRDKDVLTPGVVWHNLLVFLSFEIHPYIFRVCIRVFRWGGLLAPTPAMIIICFTGLRNMPRLYRCSSVKRICQTVTTDLVSTQIQ
jgi:hypothetical protein